MRITLLQGLSVLTDLPEAVRTTCILLTMYTFRRNVEANRWKFWKSWELYPLQTHVLDSCQRFYCGARVGTHQSCKFVNVGGVQIHAVLVVANGKERHFMLRLWLVSTVGETSLSYLAVSHGSPGLIHTDQCGYTYPTCSYDLVTPFSPLWPYIKIGSSLGNFCFRLHERVCYGWSL
ncbi:hypothetical protein EDC04DRAFT_1770115 [Pisolithus marmoratus]|nr:hypothetical protein EDC04DRAFT_1770115 [Pisolithus marmoratus]